jgi:uncharacterized membrane protein
MTDTQQGTTSTPAPRRSVLLIVSLCLNVALVVMIVVGVVNAMHNGGTPRNFLAPEALKEAATPAERARIDAIIATHAGKIRGLKDASRAAHRAAFKMFADPKFDPAAFESALGKSQDADDALRREFATVSAQSAAQLSPSERAAVAEKARRRFMWWRFFRGRRGPSLD